MRLTRHGVRWFGLLVGLSLSLGGVVLSAPPPPLPAATQAGYLGNKNSKVYHKASCSAAKRTSAKNKVTLDSPETAVSQGYKACRICKPGEDTPTTDPFAAASRRSPSRKTSGSPAAEPEDEDEDGQLKFSKDIAPILAGNCMGCHSAEQHKGEFNLSTFQDLMKGSQSGPVIVPGKPEESILVDLVVTRKMPRGGGDRRLADEAIAKIHRWVQEGALLDSGVSPTAKLDKIAPSPEQMRRDELAKLSPEERDKKLAAVAQERWTQAGGLDEPRLTTGKNFLIFSNLPEDRAEATLKTLEEQRIRVGTLLGSELASALTGPEKVSVYVFNEVNPFAEFVRSIEHREVEEGSHADGRLDVEAPYLVAVDPLRGGEEPKPARRSSRKDDEPTGPERSLTGLLSEQLGIAATRAGGKPPTWLAQGLGVYLASQVEPRSPYYSQLRLQTAQQFQLGWNTKANEVLGDQSSPEAIRALGFSLFEWMGAGFRQQLPTFIRGLVQQGGGQLDKVIQDCFGQKVSREQFLGVWGQWVALRYGSLLRRR